jgi:hypothetical protein
MYKHRQPIFGDQLKPTSSNQSPGPTKSQAFNTKLCITGSKTNEKKQNPKYWQQLKLLKTANSGSTNPADTPKEKDGN